MNGQLVFGPGQYMTGVLDSNLGDGVGCVLDISVYATGAAQRESLLRLFEKEGDDTSQPPIFELWLNSARDLILQIGQAALAIKAKDFKEFLGRPVAIIALAKKTSETLELVLEVGPSIREASSFDGVTAERLGLQVIGSNGARFELRQLIVTKYLTREDRDRLLDFVETSRGFSSKRVVGRGALGAFNMTYTAPASPLDGLPMRAVIDTNVLLDAALIVDGFGSKALAALNNAKIALYVDDIAYRDAVRILHRHQHQSSILQLERLIVDCCLRHSILSSPPGDQLDTPHVKRHDQHLARAAINLDAFVVTDDAPLRHQLYRSSIPACMSRELAILAYGEEPPPIPFLVGGLNLGSRASFIFARCSSSPTILDDGRVEATLWEGTDVGRFFYDTRRSAFAFESKWAPEVNLPFPMTPGRPIILSTSFDFRLSKATIGLRAEYFDVVQPSRTPMREARQFRTRPAFRFGQGGMTVGNSIQRGNGWPGQIEVMTWGPGKLGSDAWQTYRTVEGTAPNPFTSNVIGVAVSLLATVGPYTRLPRLMDVLARVSAAITLDERS
jgi:hypothetical protein